MPRHPSRPPEIDLILAALIEREVRFVVTGSVAAKLYGVPIDPGDLDVTPALDTANLKRLAEFLIHIEAEPPLVFGRWEVQEDGERKWIAFEPTPEQIEAKKNWRPDPDDVSSFDNLLYTTLGNFDVVPDLNGTYEELSRRAVELEHAGQRVHVMHIDELLAGVTVPRRAKDVERVRHLRQIQRDRAL